MRPIEQHIIHCSDSDEQLEIGIEDLRRWHRARGFRDIGYHYVIDRMGHLHAGRPVKTIGAHCRGMNTTSIGTCLIGRSFFTPAQCLALAHLHHCLKNIFTDIKIYGHHFFNIHKSCPNIDEETLQNIVAPPIVK